MTLGGSYGGILSGLLRMKYPNVFDMALAASAPIPQAFDNVSPLTFYQSITHDAAHKPGSTNPNCPNQVREAFRKVKQMFFTTKGRTRIQKQFKLCKSINESEWSHFMQYTRNAWTEMAMCDYPYPTNFLAPLPGWPIKVSCDMMNNEETKEVDVVQRLANVINMLYGGSKCRNMYELFVECADQTGCGLGNAAISWDYQMCTDMTIVVTSNNVTDMFPARHWDLASLTSYCTKKYGVAPNPKEMEVRLGAFNLRNADYSKIIFSNGLLDPWHKGGYFINFKFTYLLTYF